MSDALARYKSAGGKGGPAHSQEQLRALMREQDRAKFMDLQRRGFDPGARQESIAGGLDAELLSPDLNPAVQSAPYVMRAMSEPVDPAREHERALADLRWRSWQTPRGQQMRLQNLEADTALRARIEHLKNNPTPDEYGDGDFSMRKRYWDVLRYLTGQGGGMR